MMWKVLPVPWAVTYHEALAKKTASHCNFSVDPVQFPGTMHGGVGGCPVVLDSLLDLLGDCFQIRKWENPRYSTAIISSFYRSSILCCKSHWNTKIDSVRLCGKELGGGWYWVCFKGSSVCVCLHICPYACFLTCWEWREARKLLFSIAAVIVSAFEIVCWFSLCVQVCRGQSLTFDVFLYCCPPCISR